MTSVVRGRMLGLLVTLALILAQTTLACAQNQPTPTGQQKFSSGPVSETAAADEQPQKAVQNPVASLISVPLQNNTNFSYGPFNRTQDVLNIQPVIPANISQNWMVITRIIQPLVWQPYPNQNTGEECGLGDMVPTFFLSPRKPGKLIWGVGPAFTIPTATNTILGQGKLSMGPSVVVLAQPGHWPLGDLINNVWSAAGSEHHPPVNEMQNQYFITYQLKKGSYVHFLSDHHGKLEDVATLGPCRSVAAWAG